MKSPGKTYLGVMSGSSLDGLDLAWLSFKENPISYELLAAGTLNYSDEWTAKLQSSHLLGASELLALDAAFGKYCGKLIAEWCAEKKIFADKVGFHGHTVWHKPKDGFSFQMGSGPHLAYALNIPVLTQLRQADLAAGGQGAPMIAIAERDLWPTYKLFLNLGGICNLSYFPEEGAIKTFDISVCNQLLNYLAKEAEIPFDDKGQIASSGTIIPSLLRQFIDLSFHNTKPPKSLDNSFVRDSIITLWESFASEKLSDRLHTAVLGISHCIGQSIRACSIPADWPILISGGGAFNDFLIHCIAASIPNPIHLPEPEIIQYKEAIMVAWFTYLFDHNKTNFIGSASGALQDTIGGSLSVSVVNY